MTGTHNKKIIIQITYIAFYRPSSWIMPLLTRYVYYYYYYYYYIETSFIESYFAI